jgi:hypothetical protein
LAVDKVVNGLDCNTGKQKGQVLTRDKEKNTTDHCPTRQSSGRLTAAADFCVKHEDEKEEHEDDRTLF